MAELNSSGSIISGSSGYATATGASAIAVDASGNIWGDNAAGNNVIELIGAGTPVVTPFSVGLLNGTLGMRP